MDNELEGPDFRNEFKDRARTGIEKMGLAVDVHLKRRGKLSIEQIFQLELDRYIEQFELTESQSTELLTRLPFLTRYAYKNPEALVLGFLVIDPSTGKIDPKLIRKVKQRRIASGILDYDIVRYGRYWETAYFQG